MFPVFESKICLFEFGVKEKLGHFVDLGVCYNGDWETFFGKQFETIGPLWSDMFEVKIITFFQTC